MRLAFVAPQNWMQAIGDELRRRGHDLDSEPEIILCMSVSVFGEAQVMNMRYPKAKVASYLWDCYSWIKNDYRWGMYDFGNYLAWCDRADMVWVPSETEKRRYGKPCTVIKTYIKTDQLPDIAPKNGGFVLDPVRDQPSMQNGWGRLACADLGITYHCPEQKLAWPEYSKLLAQCSCAVSTNTEMSTGGLGIIEALWYGRPSVVYAGNTNAAAEYLGEYAQFLFNDYEGLKAHIKYLTENNHQFDIEETRSWIRETYSLKNMVDAIEAACRDSSLSG